MNHLKHNAISYGLYAMFSLFIAVFTHGMGDSNRADAVSAEKQIKEAAKSVFDVPCDEHILNETKQRGDFWAWMFYVESAGLTMGGMMSGAISFSCGRAHWLWKKSRGRAIGA